MNKPSAPSRSNAPAQPVALSRQLSHVAQALQAIRSGQSGAAVLQAVPAALRPGVQALLFQVLRHLGRALALRALLAPKAPAPKVDALLCAALALAWDEAIAPYTPFTLVNQTVEAAKHGPTARQAGFINASLRRFLREREALVAQTDSDLQARWNHPLWWITRLQREYPTQWQQILEANNAHAPMALRVHAQKSTPAQYLQALNAIDLKATAFGAHGVQLAKAQPVDALPGFAQGLVSVQDGAAQLAAPLLLQGMDLEGDRALQVLDACAAPGGKTAHLLELGGERLQVTALEVDAVRAQRIHGTLERVGAKAQVLVADAGQPAQWWQQANGGQPFDAILLDAPCTASGIVRRHPDVRWLRRESDVAQLAAIQSQLLDTLWPLLRPGGRLLYCTCSIFQAEGAAQVKAFLMRNTEARLLPSPGHLIPGTWSVDGPLPDNGAGDHDGFFYALFAKAP
ncbi:16S rRNA (cytosine(967)-C(5))-methyltransferase RsmB [Comamonas sp. GB3 AK4-5]|uniref:16S rRNA (cytosine(967)-C(5))-methyltransferase RsmB n=1 Tax=Comamonas sp. GB3 AK4-5 TaxID=3231487 RepID=UPI00351F088D